MSLDNENRMILDAFPALTLQNLDRLNASDRARLLDAVSAREQGERVKPPPVVNGDARPPLEPLPVHGPPLELGHRIADRGALMVRNPDFIDADEPNVRSTLLLAPGEIIEIDHVDGDRDKWNRLVTAGRIVLDADLPDPGRE